MLTLEKSLSIMDKYIGIIEYVLSAPNLNIEEQNQCIILRILRECRNKFVDADEKDDTLLVVEDGSVDVDSLEERGIKTLVYRQGAPAPFWLKKEDKKQ